MERVDYESLIIQDLLSSYDRKELNLTPWYQRRTVWTRPQKSYLINTIHARKPVPSIYIRHTIDLESERSLKEVVDGQQRIRCLLDYRSGQFAARHPDHAKPVKYERLTKPERIRFLQTALSVGYLVDASDADVIEIFARINSVAKTLSPQEKRNGRFSGAFKQFSLAESIERLSFWREHNIFTDSDIARMLEVQFVSDLIMNMVNRLQDFSASKLTEFYEKYDEDFPDEADIKERLDGIYTQLLALPSETIKQSVFSRPQVLFSLMLEIDRRRQNPIAAATVKLCLEEIDARVIAVRTNEAPNALTTEAYEAFTSGNMHRIRQRRSRRDTIRRFLK